MGGKTIEVDLGVVGVPQKMKTENHSLRIDMVTISDIRHFKIQCVYLEFIIIGGRGVHIPYKILYKRILARP